MKPGLWVSIRTTASDSSFYQYYTEWFVNDKNDKSISRVIGESDKDMTFFSTCWKDDIEGLLKRLMMENGLKHLKLDFPVVTSPYHFDHAESRHANDETMWKLFNALHVLNPGLFIACTFQIMGGLKLIDCAMLKPTEGKWRSN